MRADLTHPRPLPGGEQPFGWVRRWRRDKVLPASCRQIVLPRIASLCRQDAGSTLTASGSRVECPSPRPSPHSFLAGRGGKSLVAVSRCAGAGGARGVARAGGINSALPTWRRAGGKSSRRAISDFGFRISDFRLRNGWTLIETIVVLAVIAILAAVMVPPVIKRIDHAVWTKETADLNAIGDAFTQSILRTKTIPSHTTWMNAVASQMSLPVSAVTTNPRRYARAFYIDQNLLINGSGLPYTQTTNGATKPDTARVMIVSSLSSALPFPSGLLSSSDFDPIWNAPDGATPSTWTTWAGTGDDLRIKKINLEPLFHQLILFNHDPPNDDPARDAPFSIDRMTTTRVAAGQAWRGGNSYYLEGSDVWLLDSNFNVRTRYLLSRNISFIFESGSWRGQIQGGETFSDSNGDTASDFLKLATAFYSSPVNPGANLGASPSAVLVTMYTFMFDYVFWATECPHFDYHGETAGTPSNLPEFNMLNDIGDETATGSIGKYAGAGGLLK